MKSAVAAVTALAAVANAFSPGHHMHFPRANTTTTAPGDSQTTLTVIHTQVSTIISCAPTVTNCPAGKPGITSIPESDRVTNVVTNTVELTKTVCPVSEAGKISSSVISDHSAGKITGTPISTTGAASPATSNSLTTITTNKVHEKTITITMGGPGGSSVVPTVVRHTVQETVVVPCSETTGAEEPTTTTTATSTMTRTVTVQKPKGTDTPSKPGESGETCKDAPTVTVTVAKETVTVPASTVFVTVPCDGTQTDAASPAQTSSSGIKEVDNNKPVNNKPEDKPQGTNKGGDEDCPPDVTSTKQHTVTVVPIPYPTNGTTTANHRR